jgi:hypothetical protein
MNSETLAEQVVVLAQEIEVPGEREAMRDFLHLCASRVLGPGHDQYASEDGQTQLFETIPLGRLFDLMMEELADVFIYAVMLIVRFSRTRAPRRGRPLMKAVMNAAYAASTVVEAARVMYLEEDA